MSTVPFRTVKELVDVLDVMDGATTESEEAVATVKGWRNHQTTATIICNGGHPVLPWPTLEPRPAGGRPRRKLTSDLTRQRRPPLDNSQR